VKQTRMNGLVLCTGPETEVRAYAADLIKQISDQGEHPIAEVQKYRHVAEERVRSGKWSEVYFSPEGKAMHIKITDAPADAVASAPGRTHAMMSEAREPSAPYRDGRPTDADDHGQDYEAQAHAVRPTDLTPAVTALEKVVTDYMDGEQDPDAETRAWAHVLESALRVLGSMVESNPHAHSAAEAEYAGEQLAVAARDLALATDELPAARQPIGWASAPGPGTEDTERHLYDDGAGGQWVHPGPSGTCTMPECTATGSLEMIAGALAAYDAVKLTAIEFAERVREQLGDVMTLAPGGERLR
jgi:hypothetical protein